MSCKCQECGEQYKVDFIIPDKTWEVIKPIGESVVGGMLCGVCIARKVEEKIGYYALHFTPAASRLEDALKEAKIALGVLRATCNLRLKINRKYVSSIVNSALAKIEEILNG